MTEQRRTCSFHAQMMAALVKPETMGPNLKAIYELFLSKGDQECIADESQVVYLFGAAFSRDADGQPLPHSDGSGAPS